MGSQGYALRGVRAEPCGHDAATQTVAMGEAPLANILQCAHITTPPAALVRPYDFACEGEGRVVLEYIPVLQRIGVISTCEVQRFAGALCTMQI